MQPQADTGLSSVRIAGSRESVKFAFDRPSDSYSACLERDSLSHHLLPNHAAAGMTVG
jgi:hypothetical protein